MTNDLLPTPKGQPGRRRTVTARAWISRRSRHSVFVSNVSLGDGRVHSLTTGTHRREQALSFNRTHLLSRLSRSTSSPTPAADSATGEMLLFG